MIKVSGNPRLHGTVTFSPETVSLLETFPPTVDSLAAAIACGRILGSAFGYYPNIEGLPSNIQTSLTVTEGIDMPFDTQMSFFNGVTLGMESKLRSLQTAIAIERIRAVSPATKEALLSEISRRQTGSVRELTSFLEGVRK